MEVALKVLYILMVVAWLGVGIGIWRVRRLQREPQAVCPELPYPAQGYQPKPSAGTPNEPPGAPGSCPPWVHDDYTGRP